MIAAIAWIAGTVFVLSLLLGLTKLEVFCLLGLPAAAAIWAFANAMQQF